MAVPYHTHTFEIPTASSAEVIAGTEAGKVVTPAALGPLATLAGITPGTTGLAVIQDETAADVRTTIGVVIGTDVQAYDADLAAIAALTSAADKGIQFTGSGTAATYDLTAAGKALLDDANASAQRTTLGLAIGTDVQAFDTDLTAIAALTSAADKVPYATGAGTWALADFTAAGRALVDDASAAAQLTTLGIPAEPAVRMIEFDIRMSQFAGGAAWNDIDDDSAAMNAAITYFQTLGGLNQYEGQNAAVLRLPRGVGRLSDIDLTLAKNVTIAGLSDGATTIRNVNNNTCLKTTNVSGVNDNFRLRLKDFTIIGPGRANINAHGIDFFAVNNGSIEDVRVYACRTGMRFINNWQTNVVRPMLDGGSTVGSLSCYDGIALLDGPGSVVENGVKLTGGVVSGAERYGFRGESVSGSLIIGLELLACGSTAMYIGDSPSGKDLKWFSVVGCMFDSSGDLLVVNKGSSTVATQMHWSGLWMGNANAGTGNGEAIRLNDLTHCSFQADIISNVDVALVANSCTDVTFEYRELNDYDRSLVGAVPIQLANCTNIKVWGGPTKKLATSPSTLNLAETGTTDYSNINISHGDGGMTIIGANTIVHGNRTFKTRNSGLVNVLTTTTSTVVNHGLGRTPTDGDIIATPKFNIGSVGVTDFWIDTITATQFTIHTNAAPSSNLGFHWQADVSRG